MCFFFKFWVPVFPVVSFRWRFTFENTLSENLPLVNTLLILSIDVSSASDSLNWPSNLSNTNLQGQPLATSVEILEWTSWLISVLPSRKMLMRTTILSFFPRTQRGQKDESPDGVLLYSCLECYRFQIYILIRRVIGRLN